jgi:hypothetical protein
MNWLQTFILNLWYNPNNLKQNKYLHARTAKNNAFWSITCPTHTVFSNCWTMMNGMNNTYLGKQNNSKIYFLLIKVSNYDPKRRCCQKVSWIKCSDQEMNVIGFSHWASDNKETFNLYRSQRSWLLKNYK